MKISLCITTYNEETYIERLLESIVSQTKKPDEVIIVDGGSSDKTVARIKNYESRIKNLQIIVKKGNRPFGRNASIEHARGEIIIITDAGCELDKHWLEEITKPFAEKEVDVVSGYYAGRPTNVLQAALVPYVLVMPDKIDEDHFLPSTRSMAMKKSVWQKLGGFPTEYRWNEDYVFSKQLEKAGTRIVFTQKAIVYWFPRTTLWDGYNMFYAFAKGDMQAGIVRPKVLVLFLRGIFVIGLFGLILWTKEILLLQVFCFFLFLYVFWAMWKNYRYVHHPLAILFLPVWQLISDSAVFGGSIVGSIDRLRHKVT